MGVLTGVGNIKDLIRVVFIPICKESGRIPGQAVHDMLTSAFQILLSQTIKLSAQAL